MQRSLCNQTRVELADRTSSKVAWIGKFRLALLTTPLVKCVKLSLKHDDLATNLSPAN
ncbi:hypothetical protein D3C73_1325300 [compost metagenome]